MNLIKIAPRGFCSGVINAWNIVNKTIKKYPNKTIYMLGLFVHNENMLNELRVDNLVILDDTKLTRYELVNSIVNPENQILLLSAHGTDYQTIELAKKLKMIIIDTTCEFVIETHNVIKNALKNNQEVIFIGKKNHPESLAIAALSSNIHFIYELNQLKKLKDLFSKNVLITNQTTLSMIDLKKYYEFIRKNFKQFKIKNDLCQATIQRQQALLNLKQKIDTLIVVGSKKSNNSNQLVNIGKSKRIKRCYLVNSLQEVQKIKFQNNENVAITSGASTPTNLTNIIIKYLESK